MKIKLKNPKMRKIIKMRILEKKKRKKEKKERNALKKSNTFYNPTVLGIAEVQ
jgi:hypothetical protein